jgi:hypothetical protein
MAVLAGGAGISGKKASTLKLVETLRKSGTRSDFVDASQFRNHQTLMTEFASPGDPVAPVVIDFLESLRRGESKGPGQDYVLTLPVLKESQTAPDVQIGDTATAYLDPEFLQADHLICFADQRGVVWVGSVDPDTGHLKSGNGKDFRIADGLSRWSRFSNGPEWGLDREGASLFFLRDDDGGKGQLWRASHPWNQPLVKQITQHADLHHWLAMPSVASTMPNTRVIVYRGKPGGASNRNSWINDNQPDKIHVFAERMGIARFAYDSTKITWAPRNPAQNSGKPAQVHLLNTEDDSQQVITDDPGEKIDPWLWRAPEFKGESLLAVNVDGKALGIYRDRTPGEPWARIATIRLPEDAPHQRLKSVEPVNGGNGAFGKSYFTVQAGDDGDPDTSIWLFGFDLNGKHVVRRLDDGLNTGKRGRRLDPESLVGRTELFVYYSLIGQSPSQLRLVRTGVKRK